MGLGYVGCITCACFAKNGHEVIGVDINESKVFNLKKGISPILEPDLDDLIASGLSDKKLSFTTDIHEAISLSDLSMVCVGTPSDSDGSVDMNFIKRITKQIAFSLEKQIKEYLIVYRSTIPPGLMDTFIYPYFKNRIFSGRIHIAYNPEFLREGSAVADFYHPSRTVIGIDKGKEKTGECLLELYNFVDGAKVLTDVPTAQLIKYADNIFHALKVTFANEIGFACKKLGIDSHQAMRIFCEDKKLNISEQYLIPGKPYGGSCLPKDLKAFCASVQELDPTTFLIPTIEKSNINQKHYIASWIKSFGKRSIGIIGLTFKSNTDDLRNSPAVEIASMLLSEKIEVSIYDPNLVIDKLIGANFKYLYEKLPDIDDMLTINQNHFLNKIDLVVIFNSYPNLNQWLLNVNSDKPILDLIRIGKEYEKRENYYGLYW